MLRRLCSQLLQASKGSASLSWQKPVACHYCSQIEGDDGAKTKGQKGTKHFRVSLTVTEEKLALEFLDGMDEIMKQRKKRIESEIEEQGLIEPMPQNIAARHWKILLTECNSKSRRMTYLRYLVKNEYKKENDALKKNKPKPTMPQEHRVLDELTYPSRTRLKVSQKYASYRALTFGNPIVFDLDFPASHREQTNAIQQILACYGINMRHPYPFHMYFTGYKNTRFNTRVESEQMDEGMFATFYKDSFTDLFERERLVYLTPNGPPLKKYDGNKVYVIGGFVDLQNKPNFTYGRARELGIECGRFPLENCVSLRGSKDLTLTAVLEIMLHVNMVRSWTEAIFHGLPATQYQRLTEEEKEKRLYKRRPYLYKMQKD